MIDVVIPVAPKDYPKLERSVLGILENSRTPIREVFLIAADDSALNYLNAHVSLKMSVVKEREMPFTKADIAALLEEQGATAKHASWYYQQLLKFYAFQVIHGLGDDVLILDSDFVFAKPLPFLTDDGRAILSRGYPFKWLLNTRDYPTRVEHIHADFARRLVAGWEPMDPFSGMHHHMVLQRDILADLFDVVEREHQQPFWRAFVGKLRLEKWNAASEYVIYYHFARARYPARIVLRDLETCDIIYDAEEGGDTLKQLDRLLDSGKFDAVGCHGFLELRARIATTDYIPHDLRTKFARSPGMKLLLRLEAGVLQIEVDE
ncbi:MAG TPA: DUF6492 family protein [Polyangium sp.]|nr:DUF6492 family protein [Polyangium sp.]